MKPHLIYLLFLFISLLSRSSATTTNASPPWIANQDGISYYDTTSHSYINIETLLPETTNLTVSNIKNLRVENNDLWIHTNDSLLLQLDLSSKEIKYWQEAPTQPHTFAVSNKNNITQKPWFWILLSIGLVAIIAMHLIIQRRQTIAEKEAVIVHQKLLRSQMNPHFIFNAISAIQNDILRKPPSESSINLSKFAALIRQFLDCTNRELIELEREIKMLENYAALQQLRYSNKFSFSIFVDESIRPQNTLIPPLLNQPFVENAIEHGIKQLSSGGLITVQFLKEKDTLVVEISDNGVGIKTVDLHKHTSFATEATHKRIKMINKREKKKHTFEIVNKKSNNKDEQGTLVRYTIPYILNF